MIRRIADLLRHETAGDPMRGLKWTRKTTRKVARQLRRLDIRISASTVGRLLKNMGFSLRVNQKKLESGSRNPPPRRVRNRQFRYIGKMREEYASRGRPLISVDTKKKELIGKFKNPGVSWEKEPHRVNDHDFRSDATGIAIPYGVYDPRRTWASSWWDSVTKRQPLPSMPSTCGGGVAAAGCIPRPIRLLILADCGGGNSARSRAWKYHLQHRLCNPYGLTVTVCHYPPGASKWNPIEHRLFSQISENWAGQPLKSYETVVKYIGTTKTSSGLRVSARLTRRRYEKGEEISDQEMDQLALTRHKTLPDWNYTLAPLQM